MRSTRYGEEWGATLPWLVIVAAVLLLLTIGGVPVGSEPVENAVPSAGVHGDIDAGRTVVRLSADEPTVAEMVAAVRRQARQTPGADGDADVTVVLGGDLARELGDERPLLAGKQLGGTAFVRVDLAWPERTVIHEVAHVVTDGDGHGAIWRAVYLGVIAELYGSDAAHREERRVAWVYDKCYLSDSCPARTESATSN